MITIEKKNNIINFKGHSGYAESGKDIVCASVSCIAITTINAIKMIDKDAIEYIDNGVLSIQILKDNDIVNKLIDNMLNLLDELIEQYPKNVERK